MKLKLIQATSGKQDNAICLGWNINNELYTIGDDQKILKWSSEAEFISDIPTNLFTPPRVGSSNPGSSAPVTSSMANIFTNQTKEVPGQVFVTDMHWVPCYLSGGKVQTGGEVFAVGSADGRLYICNKTGRLEKAAEAHKGAILCLRWSSDGTAIMTTGEDGMAKIWSRSAMLRSVLIQLGHPIYSMSWSPNGDNVLLTSGENLVIKSLQPSTKPLQWKAHDGSILTVDWNFINNLIISGGEDRKFKVWDSYGRQLYSSAPHDHVITVVSWNPEGELFAVGSFNTIRLCYRLGWSFDVVKPRGGSIKNISWTPDGTQFACVSGNGSICFSHLIQRRFEWKHLDLTITDENKAIVADALQGTVENLEFRERVVMASIRYGHIIVATASQCYIYDDSNFNTPCIIDLAGSSRVITILQSREYFLIVDTVNGIQIFGYDARVVSNPKYPGLRLEFLNRHTVAMSNDVLAITDKTNEKAVYIFDVSTGRLLMETPITHILEISRIGLDQCGPTQTRFLAIMDKNRDLYLTPIIKPRFKKLGTMVECFQWNEDCNILAAVMDGKFVAWYYPGALFIDEDILEFTKVEKDARTLGSNVQFINFYGTISSLRRADGSIVALNYISGYPAVLHELTRKKQWEQALRLCRFAKAKEIWSCLAAMAVEGGDLNTAEVAYAAIDQVHKVEYVSYIKSIPTPAGRNAEMALFRNQPQEAENILLGNGLIFRGINLWITLFNWERALDIAQKFKTHVDTVIYFRSKYLESMGWKETNQRFVKAAQEITIDWNVIKDAIQKEEKSEKTGAS